MGWRAIVAWLLKQNRRAAFRRMRVGSMTIPGRWFRCTCGKMAVHFPAGDLARGLEPNTLAHQKPVCELFRTLQAEEFVRMHKHSPTLPPPTRLDKLFD